MFNLSIFEKILPPEEKIFYCYFEESAKICHETAKLFLEIIQNNLNENYLLEAKKLKHESDDIAKQTLLKLNSTFITPIDREDIQLVASHLNKIAKRIVKGCVYLNSYRLEEHNEDMIHQAETIVKATEELMFIVSQLRNISKVNSISESNQRMREIESQGDEILHKAMDNLFSGKYDPLTVLKLRDIYNNIEKALDTCFTVSDTIVNIVLKHG